MSPKKRKRKGKRKTSSTPTYIRKQGNREKQVEKKRLLSFSLTQHITNQGQTIEEWEKLGLLAKLIKSLKSVGQFSVQEALQKVYIKQYTKVGFPPNSNFTQPKHISNVTWTVMHVTKISKEVVVGFIKDDIFYIVFLDKDHDFWPKK